MAATSCRAQTTCTTLGVHCTDAQGTEVANTCSSYYRECENGVLTDVMPVAPGSKCLNNEMVMNSDCTSADCTFTGIQCTNGAGDFINTTCTGYFVECDDGSVTKPTAVPDGTSCYMNNFVISGTCDSPSCSFTGFRCSDASGTLVSNACTEYFVECDEGTITKPMPVAQGSK